MNPGDGANSSERASSRDSGGNLHRPAARLEARAKQVEVELREIFFDLVEERRATVGDRSPLRRTPVHLSLEFSPPGDGDSGCRLYEELARAADRYIAQHAVFPPGRVYCHWCSSYRCDHSSPPDTRSVFRGYSPTGQPLWQEFMSLLVERRDPRAGDLVMSASAPVALVQWGSELSKEQLGIYGKRSAQYRILAQVALGYVSHPDGLALPAAQGAPRLPVAVTFQAVVAGDPRRAPLLNIVGKLPDGTSAWQAFEETADTRLWDAVNSVRRGLEELALVGGPLSRRKREEERNRRAAGILAGLGRKLERIFRQRSRRTRHAESRHLDRKRPASTALRDALQAKPEEIFRDVEENTWIVVGPKNRVHVFNDEALHVTSATYSGETIRHRTTRGKWLQPRRDQLLGFQRALQERAQAR